MSRGRIAAAFATLSDGDGLEELIALGRADQSELRRYPPDVLAMIAERARLEMVHWATAGFGDEPAPAGFEYAISNMVLILSTYYVEAIELLTDAPSRDVGRALLRPDEWERLSQKSDSVIRDDGSLPPEPFATQGIVAGIVGSLVSCWSYVTGWRDRKIVESRLGATSSLLVRHLALLGWYPQLIDDPDSPVRLIPELHLPRLVEAAADALEDLPSLVGDFGAAALRLGDLVFLARRVPEMKEIYGASTERAFERQLALLFASLGFVVVESKPGRRWVDFLCVVDGPTPATIAIEAKSTSHAEYVFRADAQRALIEHVGQVRETLHGLPELKLVLIVAPAFSVGAAERIGQAEDQIGIRCRGFPLDLLCELRQSHIGYFPFALFHDIISDSPYIIDRETVEGMHSAFGNASNDLAKLVEFEIKARKQADRR